MGFVLRIFRNSVPNSFQKGRPLNFSLVWARCPWCLYKTPFLNKNSRKKNKITRYNNANRHLNGISACFRLPFFSDNAIIVVHFICKSWSFHCPWYTHTHTQNILLDDCRQVASWHIYYTQHRHIRFSSALERHVKDSSRSG